MTELFRNASKAHELVLAPPEQPAIVRADPARIAQALINLVSNAIKYSPDGGAVEIVVRVEEANVSLTVSDHGIGISPRDAERVFEPFRRVGAARDTFPGAGLGLSAVRRIVESHGGVIQLESAPGRGSTFELKIPRAADSSGSGHSARSASSLEARETRDRT